MFLSPRHSEIIQMAKDNGRVLVDDLATHFNVTPQTIRKDLNDLCDQRLLYPHPWRGAVPVRHREHGV